MISGVISRIKGDIAPPDLEVINNPAFVGIMSKWMITFVY